VLEFLGLPEDPSATETGIESAIISQLQSFLLEMGHGFSFVARQMRVSTETSHFYLDLVFYHYVLKCFVIIDLCALCRSAFRPLPSVWPAQEAARGVAATSRRQCAGQSLAMDAGFTPAPKCEHRTLNVQRRTEEKKRPASHSFSSVDGCKNCQTPSTRRTQGIVKKH